MADRDAERRQGLEELVQMEVADVVAAANQQAFSAQETLTALGHAVNAGNAALGQDQGPAEDLV